MCLLVVELDLIREQLILCGGCITGKKLFGALLHQRLLPLLLEIFFDEKTTLVRRFFIRPLNML
jgi:hypothetical protein